MSEGMIHKKMIGIMSDIEAIGKNKTNTQQNYKFRGIDDMYNALQPLFKKHGVFILSEVLAEKREERATKSGGVLFQVVLDVKFSFCAEDGSFVCSTVKGEAMDSGDKAVNKALSAALKYALMQTFLIPTEDKLDTEYESHEPAAKEKPADLDMFFNKSFAWLESATTSQELTERYDKLKADARFKALTPDQIDQFGFCFSVYEKKFLPKAMQL